MAQWRLGIVLLTLGLYVRYVTGGYTDVECMTVHFLPSSGCILTVVGISILQMTCFYTYVEYSPSLFLFCISNMSSISSEYIDRTPTTGYLFHSSDVTNSFSIVTTTGRRSMGLRISVFYRWSLLFVCATFPSHSHLHSCYRCDRIELNVGTTITPRKTDYGL